MIKYIVIMPYSWGKGDTITEAEKVARKEGGHGRKAMKKVCYRLDADKTPECYVDDMGGLCWLGEKPERIAL